MRKLFKTIKTLNKILVFASIFARFLFIGVLVGLQLKKTFEFGKKILVKTGVILPKKLEG
ncbi:hypothetical protein [Ligilactobacillus ceti]|uniref:Uncharacterized protein n=1 Tax=Ligilactobacillus ceti DSM 22408 TaxID=1122146 RepID=A0A0R2KMC6_9LACO|nr:hypothetical protein [Ligilactobacillus ceti]KRN88822.1 hypothetical protein IV53_GL000792 [Ligilactobacillus ceti DSM 22408]